MSSNPLISVLLPVHNGANFIEECLLSLLVQTIDNFEIIVVDDGSTDASVEIIKSFKDPRINLILNQQNQGITKSLNKALRAASGYWIARQDVDDFSLSKRFELQLDFLEKNSKVGLLGCSCFVSNRKGIFNEVFNYPSRDASIRIALPHYNPFVHGSVIMNRELLTSLDGYDEEFRYAQDYELWSRMVERTSFANLSEPLYARYRLGTSSEISVDKTPFLNIIKSRFPDSTSNLEEQIESIKPTSFYPVLGSPKEYAKLLGKHYLKVMNKAKQLEKNWITFGLRSFFYGGIRHIF